MAIGDVDFKVEYRYNNEQWIDLEYFDHYDDAVDYALTIQRQDVCRIVMYKALSEEDHKPHKTKIVAVFNPMLKGWIAKAKGDE